MDVEGPDIQGTIKDLIAHHVAITSTLAIFESFVPNRPPMSRRDARCALAPARRLGQLRDNARRPSPRHVSRTLIWPTLLEGWKCSLSATS